MHLTLAGAALTLAALSLAGPAWAQTFPPHPAAPPGHGPPPPDTPFLADDPIAPPVVWGLHSGDTVAKGEAMLYGEAGFPDVTFGFQRGIGKDVDIGVRASMVFGVEYVIPRDRQGVRDLELGLAVTVPIRVRLVHTEKLSLLVHVDPGIKFDYFDPEPFVGPHLPVGIDLGIHISPRTTVTLGVDVPFLFRVTPDPTFLVPFLAGVSLERRFTERFGMSANLRPGLLYGVNRTGSSVDMALLSQLGFFGRL